MEVLDRVEAVVNETPPVDNAASRFGNPTFKTFYDKVQQVRDGFLVFFALPFLGMIGADRGD
jgi:serine/threonine-protein phosphatase 2A activator